ncbi:hypothetical protein GGI24_002426, partial [Coemansia furcata]
MRLFILSLVLSLSSVIYHTPDDIYELVDTAYSVVQLSTPHPTSFSSYDPSSFDDTNEGSTPHAQTASADQDWSLKPTKRCQLVDSNQKGQWPIRIRCRRAKKAVISTTPNSPTTPPMGQVQSADSAAPPAYAVPLNREYMEVVCTSRLTHGSWAPSSVEHPRSSAITVPIAYAGALFVLGFLVGWLAGRPGKGPARVAHAIDAPGSTGPTTVDHAIQCAGAEGIASAETVAGSEDAARDDTATVETADEHHIVGGAADMVGSVATLLKTMPASKILPAGTGTLVELAPTTISDSTSPSNTVQPHSNIGTHTSDGGLVIDIGRTKQALFTASFAISQPEVRVTSAGAAALSAGDTTLPVALPVAQPEEQISFASRIGRPGDQLDNSDDEHANIPHEPTLADNDDECTIEGLTAGADTPQQVKLAINGASLQQQETQTRGRDNEFCGEEQHGDGGAQQLPLHADGGDNELAGEEQHGDGGAQHQPPQTHSDDDALTRGLSALQILAGQSRVFYATVNEPRIVFTEVAGGSSRLANMSFKRSVVLCERPIEELRAIKCGGLATQGRYSEPTTPAEPCASESCTDKQRRCRLFKSMTDSSSSRVAGLLAAVNSSLFGHLDETTDPQHRPRLTSVGSPIVADELPPMPETGIAGPSERLAAAAEAVGSPLGLAITVEGRGGASFDEAHPKVPCVGTSMHPLGQAADPGIEQASIPAEHESSTVYPPASSLTHIESLPSPTPTQATKSRAEQDAKPAYQSAGGPFGSTGCRKSHMQQANTFGATTPRENVAAPSSLAVPQPQEHAAVGPSNTAQPHSNIGAHTNDGGLVVGIGPTKQALFTASFAIRQPEVQVTSAGAAALLADTATPLVGNDEHYGEKQRGDDGAQQLPPQANGDDGELAGEEQHDEGELAWEQQCDDNGAHQLLLQAYGGDDELYSGEQHGDGGAQHLPPQVDDEDYGLAGEEQHDAATSYIRGWRTHPGEPDDGPLSGDYSSVSVIDTLRFRSQRKWAVYSEPPSPAEMIDAKKAARREARQVARKVASKIIPGLHRRRSSLTYLADRLVAHKQTTAELIEWVGEDLRAIVEARRVQNTECTRVPTPDAPILLQTQPNASKEEPSGPVVEAATQPDRRSGSWRSSSGGGRQQTRQQPRRNPSAVNSRTPAPQQNASREEPNGPVVEAATQPDRRSGNWRASGGGGRQQASQQQRRNTSAVDSRTPAPQPNPQDPTSGSQQHGSFVERNGDGHRRRRRHHKRGGNNNGGNNN